ncbi:hypothetical protein ACFL6S_15585 [Candidatus Poribacteria bacterium]
MHSEKELAMPRIMEQGFRLFLLSMIMSASFFAFAGESEPKPLFRDFMGINGHTVQFRPKLYASTCRLVRDYHSLSWDVGDETHYQTQFPFARNRVNWETVYGSWKQEGFDIDVSIMFGNISAEQWTDLEKDANTYGFAFARFFGTSSELKLVTSVEIGNEPGHYDDATYRKLFENMARGLRAGDTEIKILTCNMTTEESGKYARSLESLYDVINIHVYAAVEGWPTWRRSFPEDSNIDYLKTIENVIAWRDQNAKGKEIWITEFGWDASTKQAPTEGDFARWEDVSDLQQAQYLVRSFLVFSRMDVQRAYIYFFNDSDEPHVHSSSGLTRDFQPKPSFYAVSHLYRTMGNYRFRRVITEKTGKLYIYEFVHEDDPGRRILAIWSPTGTGREDVARVPLSGGKVLSATRIPSLADSLPAVEIQTDDDHIEIKYDESPVFVSIQYESNSSK